MNAFPLRITTAMLLAVACSSGKPTAEPARQPTTGEGATAVSRSTDESDAAPVPTTKPEAAAQGVFPAADEYRIDGKSSTLHSIQTK